MSWKPTTGMLRAEMTVQMLEADAPGCGFRLDNATFRWRMVQIIAGAIDSALHDGPGIAARASMVGNGHAEGDLPIKTYVAPLPAGEVYEITEVTTDPTYKVSKARGRPKKGAKRNAKAKRAETAVVGDLSDSLVDPFPKKKRGRPSKADVAARAEAEAKATPE